MEYIARDLERKFLHMSSFFKAVLVTGARQVGKTTMLRHLAERDRRTYVTMDNIMARTLAQTDPILFFQTYKPPLLIDEIQKAPELFEQIKILCDNTEEKGLIWLTGSQQYKMMRRVRETLAGRIGILELYSLSRNEKEGIVFDTPQDFSLASLLHRQQKAPKNDIQAVFRHIWLGGMPQLLEGDEEQRQEYFNSYLNTFLLRDAAEDGGIAETMKFARFVRACAALVGQQVNYATLAESCDISEPTAKSWMQVLQGMGVVYLLEPYSNNALVRLAKTPKLYFCDTGLCAWLSMWLTPETLMNGAACGSFFENYVVMELVKNFAYSQSRANITYYRDANAKEIDLMVECDGVVHPLEIKKSASPDRREVKKYQLLDKASIPRGSGGILCMCEEVVPIDEMNCYIPCNLI
ncbi:MAG: ATP-binding protein [Oscillospiraceae bacterium]|nr:ATP-binding protein [Oscillospiraceae bacterium]